MEITAESKVVLRLIETRTDTYKGKPINLPVYDVVVDGERIGEVSRRMCTRERKTPGRTYVDARWSSPGWVGNHSYRLDHSTRARAVADVISDYVRKQTEGWPPWSSTWETIAKAAEVER